MFEGRGGRPVRLFESDIALLRLAQEKGQLYSSDNEARWDRVLETGMLEGVPDQGVDWYGGYVRLSKRGKAFLEVLDRDASSEAPASP